MSLKNYDFNGFVTLELPDWLLALFCSSYHAIESYFVHGKFLMEVIALGFLTSLILLLFRLSVLFIMLPYGRAFGILLGTSSVILLIARISMVETLNSMQIFNNPTGLCLAFIFGHIVLHFGRQILKAKLKIGNFAT